MVAKTAVPNELVDSLLDFIMVLSDTLRRVGHAYEAAVDLNTQELLVLLTLSTNGLMMVKDITERVPGVSPSTLTRILDRLEENGLVARTLNPLDRRSFRVKLTDRGVQTVSEYQAQLESLAVSMLEPLTPAERMMLSELHATMSARIGQLSAQRIS
jgi:DNA-binding MarR family transcriptional regulator